MTPGVVHHADDIPTDMYDESFLMFNSLVSPWHEWLDPIRYERHVDTVEALAPQVVLSAHGPILTGGAIHDAFDRVRTLAGAPRAVPPGQETLDELLAPVLDAA